MPTPNQKTKLRGRSRAMFVAKVVMIPLIASAVFAADAIQRNIAETENIEIQQDDDGLLNTLRSHYLQLDKGNAFAGTISGIDAATGQARGIGDLEVFLVQKSKVIEQGVTDSNGEFEFKAVNPGTYNFCVAGRNGFLAYGIHLVEPLPTPADGDASNPETLEIHTQWNIGKPMKITAAVVPPEFKALRKIMTDLLPSSLAKAVGGGSDKIRINVEKSVVAGGFQVMLGDNGRLIGRITPIGSEKGKPIRLREMNVFLILDDEVYARTTVAEDGTFEFLDIEEGVYGFAAAGKDGFGAISFQAVAKKDDDTTALDDRRPFRFTSIRSANAVDQLKLAICPSEDSDFLRRKIVEIAGDPGVADLGLDGIPENGVPLVDGMFPNGGTPFSGDSGFAGGPGGGPGGGVLPGGRAFFRGPFGWLGLIGLIGLAGNGNDLQVVPTPPTPTSPFQ